MVIYETLANSDERKAVEVFRRIRAGDPSATVVALLESADLGESVVDAHEAQAPENSLATLSQSIASSEDDEATIIRLRAALYEPTMGHNEERREHRAASRRPSQICRLALDSANPFNTSFNDLGRNWGNDWFGDFRQLHRASLLYAQSDR